MSDNLIPLELIPPGVNDQRSRTFARSLDTLLSQFSTSALLVQDPLTVDARLLPSMIVSLAMTDFVPAGLNQTSLRRLLAAAPEIHKWTGTVKGARAALQSIGVKVVWKQWYQQDPLAAHDTHVVTAYVNEQLFSDDENLLSARTQKAVLKQLEATQRWSQHIDFRIGVEIKGAPAAAVVSESMQVRRHSSGHRHERVRQAAPAAAVVSQSLQVGRHPASHGHNRVRQAAPAAAAVSQSMQVYRAAGEITDTRIGLSLPAMLALGSRAVVHRGSWRLR